MGSSLEKEKKDFKKEYNEIQKKISRENKRRRRNI